METTLLYGGCVKLWLLYPPTKHNIQELSRVGLSNSLLIALKGNLEGGLYALQTEDYAMHIEAGWIHATYTLKGGFVPGITYTTAECLQPAKITWDLMCHLPVEVQRGDCEPLLRAVSMTLGLEGGHEAVCEALCSHYKRIHKLNPPLWSNIKRRLSQQNKTCVTCNKLWTKHLT
jgi:hypothetical protein